jgi:methylmalonyl-CoA/ethylmalonyl-CoA epimerase
MNSSTKLRSIEADRPGALVQLAYVVADIDAAVARWLAATAAGPFFRARFDLTGQSYRGGRVEGAAIEVALGYREDVLIELIQPADDRPSIYAEVIRTRGPGVHHVMLATVDIDADTARQETAGCALVASGYVPGFGRAAFVDTFSELGHFIEYGAWTEPVLAVIAGFRAAHRGWTGADPVRPYPMIPMPDGNEC